MKKLTILAIIFLSAAFCAVAQSNKEFRFINGKWTQVEATPKTAATEDPVLEIDTTLNVDALTFPDYFYRPVIFDYYDLNVGDESLSDAPLLDPESPMYLLQSSDQAQRRFRALKQRYMMANPNAVDYNINTLPEAPKRYVMHVDPATARIEVEEIVVGKENIESNVGSVEIERINWLQQFDGAIQFSQAYISPNWYQGGNNNLNVIVNAIYNVKLNQAFHPNLLFENTIQYKLGLNSAPEDSLRNYSISEDLFQVNSKFGVRAAKRWYYSATLQFKTQLLNNYKANTNDLKASFLSPGELNVGLGMTYEYTSPKKSFTANISVAPLSYNLKICTNRLINPASFGIPDGHRTDSQYGSNIDSKLTWKITHNINLLSRLTAFTDYSYIQADWENTLSFSINKFLSTQIYLHLRYDTQTPFNAETRWHKLQLKEILSFGFAYKIGTI